MFLGPKEPIRGQEGYILALGRGGLACLAGLLDRKLVAIVAAAVRRRIARESKVVDLGANNLCICRIN